MLLQEFLPQVSAATGFAAAGIAAACLVDTGTASDRASAVGTTAEAFAIKMSSAVAVTTAAVVA